MGNGLKGWQCVKQHSFFGGQFELYEFKNENYPNDYIWQAFDNTASNCLFYIYKSGELYDIVDNLLYAIEKIEY